MPKTESQKPHIGSDDLIPLKSRRLANLKADERLWIEGLSDEDRLSLIALNGRIESILKATGILPEIRMNIYWKSLLLGEVRKESSATEFAVAMRNIAMMTPAQFDIAKAKSVIRKQAERSVGILIENGDLDAENKDQYNDSLEVALNWRFRKHLRRFKAKPLVRTDLSTASDEKEDRKYTNYLKLRKVAQNLERVEAGGELNKDQLLALFLIQSKILKPEAIAQEGTIELIEDCMMRAKHLFGRIAGRAGKLIRTHSAQLNKELNGVELDLPNINTTLLNKHPYELLKAFFLGKLRTVDAAEVQKVLVLGFKLLQYELHPSNKASKGKEEVLSTAVNSLCEETDAGDPVFYNGKFPIYEYTSEEEEGNEDYGFFCDTHLTGKLPIRKIEIPGFEDIPQAHYVYLTDVLRKESEPVLMKEFGTKHPDAEPEDINDQIRTRIVLWQVKSSDFDNGSPNRAKYKRFLREIGNTLIETLGLEYVTSRDNITSGKATLDDSKLDKGTYRKFTILGKTKDGVSIEIQIVPFDTYMTDSAIGSPMEHENYKKTRMNRMGRLGLQYTQYPIAHRAMDIEEEAHEKSRTIAMTALERDMPNIKTGWVAERMN